MRLCVPAVGFGVLGLLILVGPVSATPLSVPTVSSYLWNNGESKAFELSWDGSQALFSVDGLGTGVYDSLLTCCTDTFDRVRVLYPGGALTFTNLAINTLPVDTVFSDNLDLSMLKQGALDNVGLLTGTVTLVWDDPLVRMPTLWFDVSAEGGIDGPQGTEPVPTPEPATLLLIGGGLIGMSRLARRSQSKSATKA